MRTCSRKVLILNLLMFVSIVGFVEAQERGITGTGAGTSGDMKYAVVIGVNRYTDSGVGQLECAVSDAEAIHQVLTSAPGGFTPERAVLLTDNQPDERRPTRANILKFLNTFVSLAGSSDTVLVYFAGHGTTENDQLYLLPSDTALSMLGDTAIPFERIKALVEASPAQRKVLILDACHSGAGRSLNRMTDGVGKQFDEASRGMVVLASCGPDEVSREMPDTGHGAFTYFLLEGLGGAADTNGDGFIGAKELSNHTWDHTRLWAAGNGWQQNPWEHSHVSGDIILARPYVIQGKPKPPSTSVIQGGPPPIPPSSSGDLAPGTERSFAGIEMVWIPPGSFMMGSPSSEEGRNDDEAQHRVTLSKGFWLGKYEVTQGQWEASMGNNPSRFKGHKNLPVETVSWEDCQEYINKLNAKGEGTFRLPTEAEWEYACRAGSTTAYSFGDSAGRLDAYAWYDDNSNDRTHPVGQKKPNPWGLYDMHGNVWEWCQDGYGDYPSSAVTDPTGATSGKYRVLRGGSWPFNPGFCRSADRGAYTPGRAYTGLGFRLLRTP